jgi:hypothetical protein
MALMTVAKNKNRHQVISVLAVFRGFRIGSVKPEAASGD